MIKAFAAEWATEWAWLEVQYWANEWWCWINGYHEQIPNIANQNYSPLNLLRSTIK